VLSTEGLHHLVPGSSRLDAGSKDLLGASLGLWQLCEFQVRCHHAAPLVKHVQCPAASSSSAVLGRGLGLQVKLISFDNIGV
jgi:hypothetical protein